MLPVLDVPEQRADLPGRRPPRDQHRAARPGADLMAPPVTDAATRREFLAMLAAAGLLAGCGADGNPAAPQPATHSITHYFGTTEIPTAPQRIVATAPAATGNLLAYGVEPVGTTAPTAFGTIRHLGDRFDALPKLGDTYTPNLEAVATLQPDLIITYGGESETFRSLYDSVRGIAPTVAPAFDYKSVEGITSFLIECGVVAGREERAREVAGAFEDRIETLRDRIATAYGERTVSLLKVAADSYSIRTGDPGASLLNALGVRRADQPFDPDKFSQELSLERVGDLAPADTIFVLFDADAEDSRAQLENNPLWATLPAVEQYRVFFVPSTIWGIGIEIHALNLMLDEIELRLT